MCRWLAYSGAPVSIDELVLKPAHSLIDQSLAARVSETTTNGDGFGLAWYGNRPGPGLYRSTRPAWNDSNLRDLAAQIDSGLFLAHIRRATGTAVQRTNCHPFRHGRWTLVHNGVIAEFGSLKRDLALAVAPELFSHIEGNTDSELLLYLALTLGLDDDPLGAVARMAGLVEQVGREHGVKRTLQMTLGISNGTHLFAIRYTTGGGARSLFHSKSMEALRELNPAFERLPDDARVIVSEPITELTDYWQPIEEGTAVVVSNGELEVVPFAPLPASAG